MAEPISITIGGRSLHGVAVVDNDARQNMDDVVISNDVQLDFKGSTVLDSGVEVSVKVTVEGEQSDDQADAAYVEVEGSFGAIRVGNDDLASKKTAVTAPYVSFMYGINDAYWHSSFNHPTSDAEAKGVSTETYANAGVGASAALSYYSPRINGFQFGASYTPEAGEEARSNSVYSQEGHDAWGVGGNYNGAIGDVGIALSVGYASKDVPMVTAKEITKMRDVMSMTFKAGGAARTNVYRQASNGAGAGLEANTSNSVNVFQNPIWDPGDSELKGDVLKAAQTAYDDAIEEDEDATFYSYNPDGNGDLALVNVFKYHEAGDHTDGADDGDGLHNVYYRDDRKAAPGRTVTEFGAGLVVSMAGVSVGGSFSAMDPDKKNADDLVQYDLGVMYGEGPWSVSANYGNKSQDNDGDGEKVDTDFMRLMGGYNLGPGIDLVGVIGADAHDNGNDTTFGAIALGVTF